MRSSLPRSWIPISAAAEPVLSEATDQWVRAVDLPAGHRQVLLKLRRGELASRIFEHLREQGIPEPSKSDWTAAITEGHVARIGGRLQLTPRGGYAVGIIMRDLASKFGIHTFTRRPARSGQGPSTHCICGWTAHSGSRSGDGVLGAHETVHHLAAAAEAKALGLPAPMDAARIRTAAIFDRIERGEA